MRILTRTALPVTLATLVTGLLACSPEKVCACVPTERESVAYVLGAHANGPAVASPKIMDDAVDAQAKLTVVAADGTPAIAFTADLVSKAENTDARSREVRDRKADLHARLGGIRPDAAEADLLTAIDLGARSLDRTPKRMVIESNGLSTAGGLSFTKPGMLMAAPDEVADDLQRKGLLPDLKGVQVTLRGIGDTLPPQEPLSIPERVNLIAIWRAVLTRAGAKAEVTVDDKPRTGAPWKDVPPVTTVAVSPLTGDPGTKVPKEPEPLPAAAFFAPDSAVLTDPARAVELLRPFADHVRDTGTRIELVGTTARVGSKEGQIALSAERAKVLGEVLIIKLGVPQDRVSTSGVGSYHPNYIPDHDERGNLLPDKAALNRTVRVTIRG